MSATTLGETLDRCPFRSIVGPLGADLLGQRPNAVIAAPEPGLGDPAPHLIAELVQILRTGGTVLVLTATAGDRERIRALLGAIRPAQWGHA